MALIFHFKCTLKMLSAVCFDLDQSEMLSSGIGLIHSNTVTPFDAPGKQAF